MQRPSGGNVHFAQYVKTSVCYCGALSDFLGNECKGEIICILIINDEPIYRSMCPRVKDCGLKLLACDSRNEAIQTTFISFSLFLSLSRKIIRTSHKC